MLNFFQLKQTRCTVIPQIFYMATFWSLTSTLENMSRFSENRGRKYFHKTPFSKLGGTNIPEIYQIESRGQNWYLGKILNFDNYIKFVDRQTPTHRVWNFIYAYLTINLFKIIVYNSERLLRFIEMNESMITSSRQLYTPIDGCYQ
jgi:hypothetical protein